MSTEKTNKTMKTTIATSMITLALSACVTEEGRFDSEGDRAVDNDEESKSATTAAEIVELLVGLSEPAEIVGLFDLEIDPESVALSPEDFVELEDNVGQQVDPQWFDDETGLGPVIELFNGYSRPACDLGVTLEAECSVLALEERLDEATVIAGRALDVYAAHAAPEHDKRRILVSENTRLAMAIHLAMATERRELRVLLDAPDDELEDYDEMIRATAGEFTVVLASIERGFRVFDAQLGIPRIVQPSQSVWQACFDSPTGPDCGDELRVETCSDGVCTTDGPADERLMLLAQDRRQARLDQAYEWVIGDEFERFQQSLFALASVGAPEEGCVGSVIEYSSAVHPEASGRYVRTAYYNGVPLYQRSQGVGHQVWSIYRQASDRWVLDGDEVGEALTGTLDTTVEPAANPREGDWGGGVVDCGPGGPEVGGEPAK
ncbi:MAG: hypothetical protein AAGF11_09270 [Myxococcota bacterium]